MKTVLTDRDQNVLVVTINRPDVRNAIDIERAFDTFAREPNGGLIVTASGASMFYRELIIMLAARHKLPAIYFDRSLVAAGRSS